MPKIGVERKRGNRLGFWFFRAAVRVFGLRGAYGLLYFVGLYYLAMDRAVVSASLAYVKRRFPGHGALRRVFDVYLLFVSQGKNLIDRFAVASGYEDIDVRIKGYDRVLDLCKDPAPFWNGARKIEEFPGVLRAELQRRWYPASIERALQPFELFAVADQDRGLGAVAYSDPWRANAIELVDAATARVYEHIIRTAWKAGLLTQEEDRRYHQAFERLRTALLVKEAAGLMPGMRIPGYAVTVEDWMVKLFAQASGDRNLYHLDEEFVAQERARGVIKFDGRIAHGILTLLISLVGLHRVADGCLIHGIEDVRYKAPVRIGDSVTPIFTVLDAQDNRIRLRVDALRRDGQVAIEGTVVVTPRDRKSTRLNSSHQLISYAVFCLKKKKN